MTAPAPRPAPSNWIRAYAQVQIAADQDIIRILQLAQQKLLADMNRLTAAGLEGVGSALRYQQFAYVRQAILREQASVMRALGRVVEARRLDAAAAAIKLGNTLDAWVLEKFGDTKRARFLLSSDMLTTGLKQTLDVALARMELSYTALAQEVYNVDVWLGSRVDQQITSALARGLSAREFAGEAKGWINPSTPGGVRYAAMRLARSEINNAFHAVSVQQAQGKPWVNAIHWYLSGSHPKPDICNDYAETDRFDMGPGVFPKREVPRKPHPHCFCYVTPEQVDEDEFLTMLTNGKYDKWIADERAMRSGPVPRLDSVTRSH